MNETPAGFGALGAPSKLLARCLLTTGQNRLELLAVEVQEERERLVRAFVLALGMAVFGLLAGMALSVVVVVWLWPRSPVVVILTLAGIYAAAGFGCRQRLKALFRDREMLPDSLDQLRKDRECLEKILQ